jgi:multiple sugar transport system substrate-binding protein
MKARPRIATCVVLLLLALSACGTPAPSAPSGSEAGAEATQATAAGEKTVITFWIFEGEEGFLPVLEERFEAKFPNIDLQVTEIPEDQYVTKIDTSLAAGETPDIAFVYEQRWLKAAKFLPIDDLIREKGIKLEEFNQGAMQACNYEAKVYCLGSYTGVVLLYYNKALFDAAGVPYPSATVPMTIDEYAAVAKQLTQNPDDINTKIWGGASSTTHWWMDRAYLFNDDGRKIDGIANDASTVHTYEVLTQMVKDGTAPSSTEMQLLGDADILAQGRQAMTIIDNVIAIPAFETQNINYGAAPPPVEQKGDVPFIPTWTDSLGVFTDSKHPREAMEFVAFLATEGNKLRVEDRTLPLNL